MVRSKFKHISKNNKSTGFFQKIKAFFTGSNLRLRVSTALLMFAVAFGVFSLGYIAVCLFAITLAIVMIYEYDRMFIAPLPSDPNIKGRVPSRESVIIFRKKFTFDVAAFLFSSWVIYNNTSFDFSLSHLGFLLFILIPPHLLISIFIVRKQKHWFLEILSDIYIWPAIFFLLALYCRSSWVVVLFFFIITIATDSGAYFVGSKFGGPKLCPRISPKKTWSGFFGGIISAVIFTKLFTFIVPDSMDGVISKFSSIYIVILLSILAQLGDLFESYLKRVAGVKDSSQFIPGHGGFLDRFDSVIFIFDMIIIFYNLYQYVSFYIK